MRFWFHHYSDRLEEISHTFFARRGLTLPPGPNDLVMKRLLLTISLVLLAFACSPVEDDTPSPVGPKQEELMLSAVEFGFPSEGGSAILEVSGPLKPILTGVPTWLKVTEGEYVDYSIAFTLAVPENKSDQAREVEIIVTSGKFKSTFTVKQEAGEQEALSLEFKAGKGEGREHRDHQRKDGRDNADVKRVQEQPSQLRRGEGVAVVGPEDMSRPEGGQAQAVLFQAL